MVEVTKLLMQGWSHSYGPSGILAEQDVKKLAGQILAERDVLVKELVETQDLPMLKNWLLQAVRCTRPADSRPVGEQREKLLKSLETKNPLTLAMSSPAYLNLQTGIDLVRPASEPTERECRVNCILSILRLDVIIKVAEAINSQEQIAPKPAGIAGAVAVAVIAAVIALFPKIGDAQVGLYPNLTGAGTHGNPAAFTPDKEWIGIGGTSVDGKMAGLSMQASRETEDVQMRAGFAQVPGKQPTGTANFAMKLNENLALGAGGGAGKGSAGAVGTLKGENTLFRGSLETDLNSNTSAAAEVRQKIRDAVELTLSGKRTVDKTGKPVFEGIGAQAKKGGNIVSLGYGKVWTGSELAKDRKGWTDITVAVRRIAGPLRLDAAYKQTASQLPGKKAQAINQATFGVTKAFNLGK